jgi:hypothetical protein
MGFTDIDDIHFSSESAFFFKIVILFGSIIFFMYYLVYNYIMYLNV